MASTNFQDYNQNTPIVSNWLNDVNKLTYSTGGVAKQSLLVPVAWVRFAVSAGVVTIQQSANVVTVVRNSVGNFTVTYSSPLTIGANCYEISQNGVGFISYSGETNSSVTVLTANTSNVATDPNNCSVVIYGAN